MTSDFASLVDMLRVRAAHARDARAYTFLADGEKETASFTYGELDRRARAIAALLLDRGLRAGDRAILLYQPGIEFVAAFFGALYAGVVAVPCYPPHPSQIARAVPRLLGILNDAAASAVLCSQDIAGSRAEIARHAPSLAAIPWLASDAVDLEAADLWRYPDIGTSTLAFLQYTSGSTAAPRGVMVSHGNLLHNLAFANFAEENDERSVSVSWLPVIHDMGLIEGVLEPTFAGFPVYLMSPAAFLQRPIRWLRAIARYRATNSGGPNFAYDLCVRKVTAEQRATLDLSCWRVAYNGSEPIRHETLVSFFETFAGCGFRWRSFYPVYGLAESTLAVSSGRQAYEPVLRRVSVDALQRGRVAAPAHEEARSTTLVASGPPSFGSRVVIADPTTHRQCGTGEIGEIWISSPSVAQGYWGRPEETARVFGAALAENGGGPYLRSGDLGVLIGDELFVVGRLKDVLIVRGMKHYPQDLELTVERYHDAIRPGCSAAFSVDARDGERVVVVAEVDPRRLSGRKVSRHELRSPATVSSDVLDAARHVAHGVRNAIALEHGIQLYGIALLPPGTIPKTSSGKIRRSACAQGWLDDSLGEIAHWRSPGLEHVERRGAGLEVTT